jgi:hypothetical protein
MTLQSKPIIPLSLPIDDATVQQPRPRTAGIDVGAEELVLVIRQNGIACKAQKFTNPPPLIVPGW